MSISAGGIGSGLDVASIVQQLVAAERAPAAGRIDRSERRLNAEISAIGTLRSAFDALRSAVEKLSSGDAANARKTSVGADAGFGASATAGAALGTYQVEVLALATADKLSSTAYTDSQTVVGTGTLTLTSGETTLDVVIDETNNTLAGIRDAINAAAAGKGVTASIVNADDGAHLVLGATATGAANALTITASGGDGGLSALTYNPPNATTMTVLSAAADAQVKVDGFERTSASNTITDMLEGVTLTLTEAAPGTIKDLTVASDPSVLRSAAKAFVKAYNGGLGAIASTTSYDTSSQVAAALNGDSLVRTTSRDLREQVSNSVGDLKTMGITIDVEGKLTMDDAAFDAALAEDPAAAERLFGSKTGMAVGIGTTLARLLDDNGVFDSRSDSHDSRTESITDQRAALDRRMEQVEARYRAQFTALDVLVAQLQSTSSFLAQQLNLL
ncbi:flagellar filament capping protein FliD [Lysobacter sp. D1-1-M9]|uniref:flagellar filament capping protein FliD n=1 Tax=Novilysobacter longmucuonensis TaxID=3098603 RepID=UPI002FCB31C1